MDFFERQDAARKKTKVLVVYFVLAVIAIIIAVYALLALAGGYVEAQTNDGRLPSRSFWQPELFLYTAGGVALFILLGSGFKSMSLSAGGSVIAKELGGRKIDSNTTDADERKLMNVVEEMAIASGVPVPEVYLMENEHSINAFAAGLSTSDAVIGVTRGCIKLLNRDELQGVIAHEFSHILNGDMRLNLRLVGLLFGILMLSIVGRVIMRTAFYTGGSTRRSSDGKGNGMPLILFGLALMIIGYIGVLFGHLIKAAISRQREFLADASAVQFTRNPDGIGGALKKIGGLSYGSKIEDPRAEEASHMFFANGLAKAMFQSFATHPPLHQRIRAIDKHWNGKYPQVDMPEISSSIGSPSPAGRQSSGPLSGLVNELADFGEGETPMPGGITPRKDAAAKAAPTSGPEVFLNAVNSIGSLNEQQVLLGAEIHGAIPEEWLVAVRNEAGAQALIFAMLLAQDDALRQSELQLLEDKTDKLTYETVIYFHKELGDLHSSQKIALIDLAIPALKRLSGGEYERFLAVMNRLIESDKQINLFEYTLQKIVKRHLDIYFNISSTPKIRYKRIADLANEIEILLSTLAGLGSRNEEEAEAAFRAGAEDVERETGGKFTLREGSQCGLRNIDEALNRFDEAAPLVKKKLLRACGNTVMADGKVVSDEAELLRAIADTIGCPIPPFVKSAA